MLFLWKKNVDFEFYGKTFNSIDQHFKRNLFWVENVLEKKKHQKDKSACLSENSELVKGFN